MKDEWIEQPAFETNEFKIGDRVRVYQYTTHIFETEVVSVEIDRVELKGNNMPFHFKSLRLLKKRERRVWWVNKYDVEQEIETMVYDKKPVGDDNIIKVQEVFNDEE